MCVFVWGRNCLCVFRCLCLFSLFVACEQMVKKNLMLSMARPPAEQLLACWRSSSALFSFHTDRWELSHVSRTGLKARPWRTLYPSAHDRMLFASLLFHRSKVSFAAYIRPIMIINWVSTAGHGSVGKRKQGSCQITVSEGVRLIRSIRVTAITDTWSGIKHPSQADWRPNLHQTTIVYSVTCDLRSNKKFNKRFSGNHFCFLVRQSI